MELTSLLTVPGIAGVITILLSVFKIKGKISPLAVNIVAVIFGIVLSATAYLMLKEFSTYETYIVCVVNGLLGGLASTGLYEAQKHLRF